MRRLDPFLRITPEKIAAAGGLDTVTKPHRNAALPSAGDGGTWTMTTAAPTIQTGIGDHSVEQTWTVGGSALGTQSLEIGWTVVMPFRMVGWVRVFSKLRDESALRRKRGR
jgi:hypothetical protein